MKELFSTKCNFGNAQNLFFNLKQKPNQTIQNFITEFNTMATTYIKKSGQAINEDNDCKFLNNMKLVRFLDEIRTDISLEIRKNVPQNFQDAGKLALKLEDAYMHTNMQELNNIAASRETEILNKLHKLSLDSTEKMQTLVTEINNLKLKVNEKEEKVKKFCM